MKRNIEVVNASTSAVELILDSLENIKGNEINDVYKGFSNLKEGKASSLLIEMGERTSYILPSKMVFGDLSIEINTRRVIEGGRDINLTPKEFDILYFLASNCGQVFTKEQIYSEVWETSYCLDDSNIMAFIRKLRKKIEPDPDSPIYILTVWGIGYKFNDRI